MAAGGISPITGNRSGRPGMAEPAIIRGKRDRKPPVRAGAALPVGGVSPKPGRQMPIECKPAYCGAFASVEQQEQQVALLSGKTGSEVSSSSCRSRSPVTASKSLRSMARSLRLRPRNLSKIRIPSSVIGGTDDAGRRPHDLCRGSNSGANDAAICAPTKSLDRNGL